MTIEVLSLLRVYHAQMCNSMKTPFSESKAGTQRRAGSEAIYLGSVRDVGIDGCLDLCLTEF